MNCRLCRTCKTLEQATFSCFRQLSVDEEVSPRFLWTHRKNLQLRSLSLNSVEQSPSEIEFLSQVLLEQSRLSDLKISVSFSKLVMKQRPSFSFATSEILTSLYLSNSLPELVSLSQVVHFFPLLRRLSYVKAGETFAQPLEPLLKLPKLEYLHIPCQLGTETYSRHFWIGTDVGVLLQGHRS